MKVLVIDIGGSHVKLLATGESEPLRFDSGPGFTPQQLVDRVRSHAGGWEYDAISIGYPGSVGAAGPAAEPGNLGPGWVGFDFEKALGKSVRLVNDAALQAVGAYDAGRMLFLGLGTGVGSALVVDRVVIPLELGNLPFDSQSSIAERLGKQALEGRGRPAWLAAVRRALAFLSTSFVADYVVLGGGNAGLIDQMPPHVRRGGNDDAFTGGFRLWEDPVTLHRETAGRAWRVMA